MRSAALAVGLAVLGASFPARADRLLERTHLLDAALAAPEAPAQALSTTPRPVRRGVGWALLPFGIGQYANDQPVKGTLVCVSEILLFATAGAALGVLESYKTSSDGFLVGGEVPNKKVGDALMITYLAAFWAGVAVVGIGIADALVYRPAEETTVAVTPTAVAVKF